MFRSRAFSAGNAAIFCAVGGLFCAVFFMAQFLQAGLGYGPLGAGLRLLPWTATCSSSPRWRASWSTASASGRCSSPGCCCRRSAFGWIALVADPGMAYSELIAPLMVAGVGISMAFPAAQNAVVGSVPRGDIGKAAGSISTMRQLGGVFGVAIGRRVRRGRRLRLGGRVQRRLRRPRSRPRPAWPWPGPSPGWRCRAGQARRRTRTDAPAEPVATNSTPEYVVSPANEELK